MRLTQGGDVMMRGLILSVSLVGALAGAAAFAELSAAPRVGTERQIDFAGFQSLSGEVRTYRAKRLVTLAQFQAMARDPNTVILDARSAEAFAQGHIQGAINLPLPDFTAEALAAVLKRPDRRILIYCNNNFENDAPPVVLKAAPLSLNIQTFINLYGYGYRNVYELGDVVNFNDRDVRWVRGT
jgi:rhodanese-related sulfurtransferase